MGFAIAHRTTRVNALMAQPIYTRRSAGSSRSHSATVRAAAADRDDHRRYHAGRGMSRADASWVGADTRQQVELQKIRQA
jgi:hypothetical protein